MNITEQTTEISRVSLVGEIGVPEEGNYVDDQEPVLGRSEVEVAELSGWPDLPVRDDDVSVVGTQPSLDLGRTQTLEKTGCRNKDTEDGGSKQSLVKGHLSQGSFSTLKLDSPVQNHVPSPHTGSHNTASHDEEPANSSPGESIIFLDSKLSYYIPRGTKNSCLKDL